jgi:hypothetical protein
MDWINYKNCTWTYILTELVEIYRLVCNLTLFEEKTFWSIFVVRVPFWLKRSQTFFLSESSQITHQTIDLDELIEPFPD